MFFIGLTGQTGAGKTYVSDYFKKIGFSVINCDEIVNRLYNENDKLKTLLAKEFGEDIIKDNCVDKKKLSSVFSSRRKLEKLNNIVHPFVFKECEKENENASSLCVLDAPQLFEAGMADKCTYVVSVIAPYAIRRMRIMERDHISKIEADMRMNAQFPERFYKENADFIITSNDDVLSQICDILDKIEPLEEEKCKESDWDWMRKLSQEQNVDAGRIFRAYCFMVDQGMISFRPSLRDFLEQRVKMLSVGAIKSLPGEEDISTTRL